MTKRLKRIWPVGALADKARRLLRSANGATAIEYALIACLVSLGLIFAISSFGSAARNMYDYINTNFSASTGL